MFVNGALLVGLELAGGALERALVDPFEKVGHGPLLSAYFFCLFREIFGVIVWHIMLYVFRVVSVQSHVFVELHPARNYWSPTIDLLESTRAFGINQDSFWWISWSTWPMGW